MEQTLLHRANPNTLKATTERVMTLSSLIIFHGVCSSSMMGTSRQVSHVLLNKDNNMSNSEVNTDLFYTFISSYSSYLIYLLSF